MSHPVRSVGSRIVEVVINDRISRAVTLGKRKASEAVASLDKILPSCSSSPILSEDEDDNSDFEAYGEETEDEDAWESDPLKGVFHPPGSETPSERPFRCTHPSCTKSYTKPSRLAEHVRSHTGERPYQCTTCTKSYLRESHLQAHSRSHLPASDRPFACTEGSCCKRFWTTQHLRVHIASVHQREKPFRCSEDGCDEHFAKHSQVRRHIAAVHRPPGTQPYQCLAEGCGKSFATNQKLRKHSQVHEGNRYACTDTLCMTTTASGSSSPLYFPTWSALQTHIRDRHPPMCHYPDCNGRTFTSHNGLEGHLKVHEEREIEAALEKVMGEDERPIKRRRGGEVGRDWTCKVEGCVKAFKSEKALTTHHNVTHLGRRDHVCSYPSCGQTFGYKHLLQRHCAKMHSTMPRSLTTEQQGSDVYEGDPSTIRLNAGAIHTSPSTRKHTPRAPVPCPWPDQFEFENTDVRGATSSEADVGRCADTFSRAYDLRRHLKAYHDLELTKDEMDDWVRDWRERHTNTNGSEQDLCACP